MACECAYKAGTFLVCRKSAPPAPCVYTGRVPVQHQPTHIWYKFRHSNTDKYKLVGVSVTYQPKLKREAGCCVFVCLHKLVRPPMAAFQTLPEESSEPFRCQRRISENEAVNKSQSSQHLFLNSEVSAVFPKISFCQQSIHVHVASRILSVFI